jgi:outer membrane biosynthesis protein TonB
MRQAVALSGFAHVLLIIAASVVWPRLIQPLPVEQTMSVELVNLASETRAPKPTKAEPRPKVETQPVEPAPEPLKSEPPPPPVETKPLVSLPPPPKDMPKFERTDLPAPTPLPKLAVRPQELPKLDKLDLKQTLPEPPKERAKTKPVEKPVEKKPETFDLSKIAQSLNKLDKKPDSPAKPSNSPQAQPQPSPPQITNALEGGLSMSEKDALRAIIGRNWNVPTGAPRPEDLIVIVRFSLNPDGTLAGAPQLVNSGSYASNSFFRAAADAALRAVQMTQPFKLPANKYNDWREIVLTFDPRDMISSR